MSPGWLVTIVAIAVLSGAWLVYPLVMVLAARLRAPHRNGSPEPRAVSVVIATRDTPELLAARVQNLLACNYPHSLLQVVVAIDRDAPHKADRYRAVLGAGGAADDAPVPIGSAGATLRITRALDAAGKSAALDAGVRCATGDIVVFADSAQKYEPDALGSLVRYLSDTRFGAVSGRLCSSADAERASVLGAFWSYETLLRRVEARVHSIPAVTGAIYAMRRALWKSPPHGLICDDLFVPLSVVRSGFRVGYCHEARAYDPRLFSASQELHRKVRTLTGMIQMCAWEPWILVPLRNPIWLQFVCHKLIRLATPLLAASAAAGIAWELAAAGWLQDFAAGAILSAGSALMIVDLRWPGAGRRVADRALMVLRLLASPLLAMGHALRGNWNVWAPVRPQQRIR